MHGSHRMVDIDTVPAFFSENPHNFLNQNLLLPSSNKLCRMDELSSAGLESITRVLSNPQKGHFISYPPVFLSLMFTFIVPVIIPEK